LSLKMRQDFLSLQMKTRLLEPEDEDKTSWAWRLDQTSWACRWRQGYLSLKMRQDFLRLQMKTRLLEPED
jgi:hypothetical protein